MTVKLFHCSSMDVLSAVRIAQETARREGFQQVDLRDEVIIREIERLQASSPNDDLILTTKTELLKWIGENV